MSRNKEDIMSKDINYEPALKCYVVQFTMTDINTNKLRFAAVGDISMDRKLAIYNLRIDMQMYYDRDKEIHTIVTPLQFYDHTTPMQNGMTFVMQYTYTDKANNSILVEAKIFERELNRGVLDEQK